MHPWRSRVRVLCKEAKSNAKLAASVGNYARRPDCSRARSKAALRASILPPAPPLAVTTNVPQALMNSDPQARTVPPSRRRDKPIVSCSLCRRRKLKCDRQSPCKTCVDRGLALSCTYVRNVPTSQEPKAPNSVHDRIDQLEKLVTSLMSGKEVYQAILTTPTLPHFQHLGEDNDTERSSTPDRVRFTGDTTSYTNSAHWASILDGVRYWHLP